MDKHYTSKHCSTCKYPKSMCMSITEMKDSKDVNGCLNMLKIVRAHARGETRPCYLHFDEYEQVLDPQKSPAPEVKDFEQLTGVLII